MFGYKIVLKMINRWKYPAVGVQCTTSQTLKRGFPLFNLNKEIHHTDYDIIKIV